MKSCYWKKLGDVHIAIADLCDYYNLGFIITRINVPRAFRGQGEGRELLKQITSDADKEGRRLFLEISPSDGLSFHELEAWYMRAGFKRWKGIYMRRPISVPQDSQAEVAKGKDSLSRLGGITRERN
jgi:GNAT superfamily N-acetyltransferase